MSLMLDNGDKIRGATTTASKVDYLLHGIVGTTPTQLADGQLPNAIGDLYTAGAAVAVTGITCFNTNTTTELVILYLTPSAGTARTFAYVNLPAKAQLYTDGQKIEVMDSSGNIQTSNASILDNTAGGTNGEVTKAPTSDVLFDALALKAPLASPTFTGTVSGLTLGSALVLNAKAIDAGSGNAAVTTTGAGSGLSVISTQDTSDGPYINLKLSRVTPTIGDYGVYAWYTKDSNGTSELDAYMQFVMTNITHTTESCDYKVTLVNSGSLNEALILTSAGLLSVDLGGSGTPAQVDLFDKYDDAVVLRQGIQENNRALLADMGILDRKKTGSGYMLKVQPMIRLLAGGIYQTRQRLEDTKAELLERLEIVERKLLTQ